jgi:hypothetical protein
MNPPTIQSASVKVMRSHDYCHFEVCLSSSDADTPQKVDELRKEAARLADKAVAQYRIAKAAATRLDNIKEPWRLEQAQRTPEGERTPTEKAIIKYHADAAFAARFNYDYQDDYDTSLDDDDL